VASTDRLVVELEVLSPSARTTKRLVDRSIAIGAWLAAFAAAYAAMRWLGRRRPAAPGASGGNTEAVLLLILLAIAVVAMIGQLAFVRPIMRTTAAHSTVFVSGLLAIWALALVVGAWRGLRARARGAWFKARLRAVIGSPGEAGSRLPPDMSRETPPCSAEQLADAARTAGYSVEVRRRGLSIGRGDAPVARIATKRSAPWLPEDLAVRIVRGADAVPLVAALATVFGPLEYAPDDRPPSIVESGR
jgi:hypothetical protein